MEYLKNMIAIRNEWTTSNCLIYIGHINFSNYVNGILWNCFDVDCWGFHFFITPFHFTSPV